MPDPASAFLPLDADLRSRPNPDRALKRRRAKAVDSSIDRLPPHSLAAEQGVLGCVLLDPTECLPDCIQSLKGQSEVFYDLRHRMIFEALLDMAEKHQPIDLLTLQQRLLDAGQLEAVGGGAYVSQLPDTVPSAANLAYYLDIVRNKYLLRRLLGTCRQAADWVYEGPSDVPGLLDRVEHHVLQINQERFDLPAHAMRDLTQGAIDRIQFLFEHRGQLTGVGSGFRDLDRLTGGFHGSEMIVIAARPSVGKTSLAMNMAEHVALDLGQPVGVFSLEMSAEALVLRMLCSRARVNLKEVRDGFLRESDFTRLHETVARLFKAPLFIDDTGGLTILELKARARRLRQKHRIALFIVDYLQLCRSDSTRAESRQQEIADISSGLKALAKELQVPIVVLSQLNRELERAEKKRKPQLSDLRESGAIEQDADLVGLLYKWTEENDEATAGAQLREAETINLLLAKHRNGPTGDIPLTFLRACTRFENHAPIAASDLPSRTASSKAPSSCPSP